MRIIQAGLLLVAFVSLRSFLTRVKKQKVIGVREVIFISTLVTLSPLFHFLALVFPGKLETSVAGTNFGIVIQAIILALASFGIIAKGVMFGSPQSVGLPIVFLGIYVVWAAMNGFLLNQSWIGSLSLVPLILAIAFGNISLIEIELGLSLSLAIITSGAFLISLNREGLMDCRMDKCLIVTKTFNFVGSQNSFSISVALLGITLMYIQKDLRQRIYIFIIALYLTILGGSRSAVYTLIIIGTLLALAKVLKSRVLILLIMRVTLVISLGGSLIPIYMTFTDDAFTSRGILWRKAKEQIRENWILGNGQSFWTRQYSFGGFVANYGTHNIWLDNLVAFGFVGLVLFLTTLISIKIDRESSELYVLLSAIFILGSTESSFQFWKLSGGIPYFLVLLLIHKISVQNLISSKKSLKEQKYI